MNSRKFFVYLVLLGVLLLVLLTACQPGSSEMECQRGVCIGIRIELPTQAYSPVPFTIIFRTDSDISDLAIYLEVQSGITVEDIITPADIRLLNQDQYGNNTWSIATKGGEEYKITGYFVMFKPSSDEINDSLKSGLVIATAILRSGARITDSIRINTDAKGNYLDDEAMSLAETQTATYVKPARDAIEEYYRGQTQTAESASPIQESQTPTVIVPAQNGTLTPQPSAYP